jgi:hypothetical protein
VHAGIFVFLSELKKVELLEEFFDHFRSPIVFEYSDTGFGPTEPYPIGHGFRAAAFDLILTKSPKPIRKRFKKRQNAPFLIRELVGRMTFEICLSCIGAKLHESLA